MKCKEAISLIHEYLDQDFHEAESDTMKSSDLHDHLQHCDECRHQFSQLEKTEALIRSAAALHAPNSLSERVMASIPFKRDNSFLRWAKRYPAVTAAAVFICVMLASVLTLWNQDADTILMVKGNNLDYLVIEGNQVTVPEGQTIQGDLTIENGSIQVDGFINGNLIIIDGTVLMASTANISGKVTKINQAIDWFWYKMSGLFSSVQIN